MAQHFRTLGLMTDQIYSDIYLGKQWNPTKPLVFGNHMKNVLTFKNRGHLRIMFGLFMVFVKQNPREKQAPRIRSSKTLQISLGQIPG